MGGGSPQVVPSLVNELNHAAAELAVKGESMAIGMRAATIKEACGVVELAIKGVYCGRH